LPDCGHGDGPGHGFEGTSDWADPARMSGSARPKPISRPPGLPAARKPAPDRQRGHFHAVLVAVTADGTGRSGQGRQEGTGARLSVARRPLSASYRWPAIARRRLASRRTT